MIGGGVWGVKSGVWGFWVGVMGVLGVMLFWELVSWVSGFWSCIDLVVLIVKEIVIFVLENIEGDCILFDWWFRNWVVVVVFLKGVGLWVKNWWFNLVLEVFSL